MSNRGGAGPRVAALGVVCFATVLTVCAVPAAAGSSGKGKAKPGDTAEAATLKDAQSRGVIVIKPSQAASPEAMSPSASAEVVAPAPPPATLVLPTRPAVIMPTPAPQIAVSPAPAPASQIAAKPSPASLPAAVVKACARPLKADVQLSGKPGSSFTRQLRSKLAARRPVVVDLAAPFAVGGDAPAALAPWIAQVKASGGSVTADEYCHESRGMFSFLRKFFGRPAASPYAAADNYNAVLHIDGLDQVVTQVEFRPRSTT